MVAQLSSDSGVEAPRCGMVMTWLWPSKPSSGKSVTKNLICPESIFFSNEEAMLTENVNHNKFYDTVIMPYKGQLEIWYVRNATFRIDLTIIYLTARKIIFPKMHLDLSKYFYGVARPPKALQNFKLN